MITKEYFFHIHFHIFDFLNLFETVNLLYYILTLILLPKVKNVKKPNKPANIAKNNGSHGNT